MTPLERAHAINEAERPKLQQLIRAAEALATGKRPQQERAEGIIDIAEALSKTITPHTPCASGTCSHCCYMATALSGYEARMIGRYVGRTPRALGRELTGIDQATLVDAFTGVRCPFLTDAGRCGVYPVRPVACRLHHNLEDTPDNCVIVPGDQRTEGEERERKSTPHLNLRTVQNAVAIVYVAEDFGDIREFFPSD